MGLHSFEELQKATHVDHHFALRSLKVEALKKSISDVAVETLVNVST
jgi:hypothetical protein